MSTSATRVSPSASSWTPCRRDRSPSGRKRAERLRVRPHLHRGHRPADAGLGTTRDKTVSLTASGGAGGVRAAAARERTS
ncbi:hypothetical protein NKH77_23525 [Streptomyces sp. M19]